MKAEKGLHVHASITSDELIDYVTETSDASPSAGCR